jgi:hypothetical protein
MDGSKTLRSNVAKKNSSQPIVPYARTQGQPARTGLMNSTNLLRWLVADDWC